jgi:hypothetical protein
MANSDQAVEPTLSPSIKLLDNNRIEFRSRIRFRPGFGSDHMKALLESRRTQVCWDDNDEPWSDLRPILERGVFWPLDETTAILEVSYTGPRDDPATKGRHDVMMPAHVRHFQSSAGSAEIVPWDEFEATDPRS